MHFNKENLNKILAEAKRDTKEFWNKTIKTEAKKLWNNTQTFWQDTVKPEAKELWNKTKAFWRDITNSSNAETDILIQQDCSSEKSQDPIKSDLNEVAEELTDEPASPSNILQEEVGVSGNIIETNAEQ
jgi:hypothetical protein